MTGKNFDKNKTQQKCYDAEETQIWFKKTSSSLLFPSSVGGTADQNPNSVIDKYLQPHFQHAEAKPVDGRLKRREPHHITHKDNKSERRGSGEPREPP